MAYKHNFYFGLLVLLVTSFGARAGLASDPTKPGLYPLKTTHDSNDKKLIKAQLLTAIFSKSGIRKAIIDGQLYAVGDFVGNKKITAIKNTHVLLQSNSGQTKLHLLTNFKKASKTKK